MSTNTVAKESLIIGCNQVCNWVCFRGFPTFNKFDDKRLGVGAASHGLLALSINCMKLKAGLMLSLHEFEGLTCPPNNAVSYEN